MRTFNVSVKNGEVKCSPKKMHVPPQTFEEFAICLNDDFVRKYDLSISLDEDEGNWLKKDKMNSSFTVLQDNNNAPGRAKFSILLTPLPRSKAKKVTALDPIIVNE